MESRAYNLNNLRVVILTTKGSTRLINGKPSTYPSFLPEPEIFYGTTPDDNISVPDWYKPVSDDKSSCIPGYWCCWLGHLAILRDHYNKYPTKDLLILEDDVAFIPQFNKAFLNFMKIVPKDWEVIWFGGIHYKKAKEVVHNVLSPNYILNSECILYKSTSIPRVINELDPFNGIKRNLIIDQILSYLHTRFKMYTPICNFAYQGSNYSYIQNAERPMKSKYDKRRPFINLNGYTVRPSTNAIKVYL